MHNGRPSTEQKVAGAAQARPSLSAAGALAPLVTRRAESAESAESATPIKRDAPGGRVHCRAAAADLITAGPKGGRSGRFARTYRTRTSIFGQSVAPRVHALAQNTAGREKE